MDKKLELEKMCKESWERLNRTEEALGIDSPEARMFRAEWSAFYRSYRLLFGDVIVYNI